MPSQFPRPIRGHDGRASTWAARRLALLLFCALGVLLAGCDAGAVTRNAQATSTAAARATEAAQPLVVAVALTQHGTLSAQNVQLDLAVTMTNQTSALVAISNVGCPYTTTLAAQLRDPADTTLWQNYGKLPVCTYFPPRDDWTIPAGASLSKSLTADLFVPSIRSQWISSAPALLQAGTPYLVVVTVPLWHQGALADIDQPGVLHGRDVSGRATVVFQ